MQRIGELGQPVAELQQVIAKGLLHETARRQVEGREIIRYEGTFSEDYPFRRVVLADGGTGFPLDDRMCRPDGVLFSCRLADLEVVEGADLGALFSLAFPTGAKPMTDEQLPQLPERIVGLAACLEELARASAEVPFPLYCLGESFDGLPLDMVEPAEKTGGVRSQLGVVYRDPGHATPAHVAVYLYDQNLARAQEAV